MKKFIGKLVIYVLILAVITVGINAVYVKLDTKDPYYIQKYKNMPDGISVCNMGSSHGLYAFNYVDYEADMTCFNFAMLAQLPTYDYRLLENYQDHLGEGCTVFIPVSYFDFIGVPEEEEYGFDVKNTRYYPILPAKMIKNFNLKDDFRMNMPAVFAGGEDLFYVFTGREQDSSHPEWDHDADEMDMAADVVEAYTRHFVDKKKDADGNYRYRDEEFQAFYDMINLCNEKGWRAILVTVPLPREYMDLAWGESSDYLEEFYKMVDNIVQDTSVEYYDYSMDERFLDRHDYFMNGDHMNRVGAEVFTDILFEEVLAAN